MRMRGLQSIKPCGVSSLVSSGGVKESSLLVSLHTLSALVFILPSYFPSPLPLRLHRRFLCFCLLSSSVKPSFAIISRASITLASLPTVTTPSHRPIPNSRTFPSNSLRSKHHCLSARLVYTSLAKELSPSRLRHFACHVLKQRTEIQHSQDRTLIWVHNGQIVDVMKQEKKR